MRKTFLTLFAILTLTFLVTGCASTQTTTSPGETRTLNVTGTGTVSVEPDIAHVNIGVQSRSPDASEALAENNANANAIRRTLMELGVAENDIQTSNFNIYRQQVQFTTDEDEAEETFVVENTVSVGVRQLDSLGEVLSAVVQQGANTIYGVTFDVEDPSTLIAQARELALEDARSQAEAIADAAGVKLGAIYSLNINEGGAPMTQEMAVNAADGLGGSVPISSGTLSVQVSVYIVYEFD